jgi:hypothetical protein
LPVVVPNLGALPERVAGRPWSWIVDWDWPAKRLLEFFLDIRQRHFIEGRAPEPPKWNVASNPATEITPAEEFYGREYL